MRKIKTSIYNIFFGKRILILGYGREGKSTLNFLRKFLTDANITIADKNTSALDELKNKNIFQISESNGVKNIAINDKPAKVKRKSILSIIRIMVFQSKLRKALQIKNK